MTSQKIIVSLFTIITLASCTTSYHETLDEKLAGKTPTEKRILLAQECEKESKAGLKKDDPASMRHFENMKKICAEMTSK